MSRMLLVIVAGVVGLAADRTWAQSAPGAWQVDATIGAVSDYRFRGMSLSADDPAVQGGVTVSHASGVYGDVWVSTIDEYGLDADGDGAEVEVTLRAGWSGETLGYVFDLGIDVYRYPGGTDVNYVEFPVSAERAIGPVTLSAGVAWAPEQDALGDEDNRYLWTGVEVAPYGWPVSLNASLGHEDGAYAPGGKTDWSAGFKMPVSRLTLGLDYIDSDAGDGTVVASVFASF